MPPAPRPPAPRPPRPRSPRLRDPEVRLLLVAGFLTFAVIGASQALYGPAFPALRARYGVSLAAVGNITGAHFLGSFLAIAATGWLVRRFGYARPLAASTLVLAAGAAGVAWAPGWPLALAAAFVLGLGFGVADVAVNLLFARSFGAAAAPALNLLNAMFGVGAVVAPLLVAALLPRVGAPFLIVAAGAVLAALLLARLPEPGPEGGGTDAPPLRWGRVGGFMLLLFLYVSSEVGVASWETEHLTPHLGAERAAGLTAVFWLALTGGRVIAAPVSARLRSADLVGLACALGLAGVALAHLPAWAPFGYALTGFAFAPVFPTTVAWIQETFPARSERIIPIAVAAANLGPVLVVPLVGVVAAATSTGRIPTLLAALVAGLLATALALRARRG